VTFTVTSACVGCGACLATCPERAFRIVRGKPPLVVLAHRCTGCAECAEVCPVEACVTREWAASRTPPVGGLWDGPS
jgi:Pyruvate/2-oxoacid:ferredoxin oxidoreductase delta subunit